MKINKWDGAAAKNAVDDAIREVNHKVTSLILHLQVLLFTGLIYRY